MRNYCLPMPKLSPFLTAVLFVIMNIIAHFVVLIPIVMFCHYAGYHDIRFLYDEEAISEQTETVRLLARLVLFGGVGIFLASYMTASLVQSPKTKYVCGITAFITVAPFTAFFFVYCPLVSRDTVLAVTYLILRTVVAYGTCALFERKPDKNTQ